MDAELTELNTHTATEAKSNGSDVRRGRVELSERLGLHLVDGVFRRHRPDLQHPGGARGAAPAPWPGPRLLVLGGGTHSRHAYTDDGGLARHWLNAHVVRHGDGGRGVVTGAQGGAGALSAVQQIPVRHWGLNRRLLLLVHAHRHVDHDGDDDGGRHQASEDTTGDDPGVVVVNWALCKPRRHGQKLAWTCRRAAVWMAGNSRTVLKD